MSSLEYFIQIIVETVLYVTLSFGALMLIIYAISYIFGIGPY